MNRLVTTVCNVISQDQLERRNATYLESSEDNTKDGQEETSISKAHLAERGHGSANNKRNKRHVSHKAVGAAVPDTENEDGEDRAKHAHRLVKGNGDHGERQVRDGNVGGEEGAEGDKGEVLAAPQARHLEVAQLHHGRGTGTRKRRMEESEEPREGKL